MYVYMPTLKLALLSGGSGFELAYLDYKKIYLKLDSNYPISFFFNMIEVFNSSIEE